MKCFLMLLICMLFFNQAKSQGSIEGIVMDSTLNNVLPSVTISVYDSRDSSLLKYSLTDHHGFFNIKDLPSNKELNMRISCIGYRETFLNFSFSDKSLIKKLGKLFLLKAENIIEEVVVSRLPPVRMNGDTLEFNASAFNLDSNAVAEDLLRKLPGVIVWGDGSITVNGKEINKLLINGKPFFGGEYKIATQNIPTKVIKKVQIYQENIDPNNLLDSISTMNIQLNKGKVSGLFGKIGTSMGTRNTFDIQGNVNFFSPKVQLAIIANLNNVNKGSNDINLLIKNASYKGNGALLENEPNLLEKGEKQFSQAGFLLSYDFIPDKKNKFNLNKVTADYLYNHNIVDIKQKSNEIIFLNNDDERENLNIMNTYNDKKSQKFNGNYNNKKGLYNFSFGTRLNTSEYNQEANKIDSIFLNDNLLNSHKLFSAEYGEVNDLNLGVSIQKSRNLDINHKIPNEWSFTYSLDFLNADYSNTNEINFNSFLDTLISRDINRNNKFANNTTSHKVNIQYGNFAGLFFDKNSNVNITAKSIIENTKAKHQNSAYDNSNNVYEVNESLTYDNRYNTEKYYPSISINKNYIKSLSNRFQKILYVGVDVGNLFFHQKSLSNQQFQVFERNYSKFIPNVYFNYEKNQYGAYNYKVNINATKDYYFPNVTELAPVTDSSDVYNISIPNTSLLSMYTNKLNLAFNLNKFRNKNTFKFFINLTYLSSPNYISNSLYYDLDGRSYLTSINLDGYKNFILQTEARKSLQIKNSLVQLGLKSNSSIGTIPSVINTDSIDQYIISNNLITNNSLFVIYNTSEFLAVSLSHDFNLYKSKSSNQPEAILTTNVNTTHLTFAFNIGNKISIKPNIAVYKNRFSKLNQRYNILNFDIHYRTLKNKNLEIKFSAYDIFNENRQVENIIGANSFRQTQFNSLNRYYMFSLSYFIRKF